MQCFLKPLHALERNDSPEPQPATYERCGDGHGQLKLSYRYQGDRLAPPNGTRGLYTQQPAVYIAT